jgi:hypothetical protein
MPVGTLVDNKEEAKRLKDQFNSAWPEYKYHYQKLKHGYYVWGEKVSVGGKP